jgi:Uma2 family endonuclease
MTMTRPAPAAEPDPVGLRDVLEELELPEGFRAEIINGSIVVSPAPLAKHNLVFAMLSRQLNRICPDEWAVTNTQAIALPDSGSYIVPDLVVCAEQALDVNDIELPPDAVMLAAEITSASTANRDRSAKRDMLAKAGVPLYLLIDRYDGNGHVTLFAKPSGDGYQELQRVLFGSKILLPEPFDAELDTSRFPRT